VSVDCRDHATMKVDLTPIKHKLKKVKGVDGHDYYRVDFNILAQYHSAHVEYKWEFQGTFISNMRLLDCKLTFSSGEIFDKVKCNYI
jgi:hypothetical protein